MKIAVVGAGAWGLPAATQLARRKHNVTLFEAYDVGHPYASSSGDTRLYRLSHTDAAMVRLGLRAVGAWRLLERDSGSTILLPRGLLWRGSTAPAVASALAAEDVSFSHVNAADVGSFFAGLRPNGSDAVWQSTAGSLLAAESLRAHLGLFIASSGRLREHTYVQELIDTSHGVDITSVFDGVTSTDSFDSVVVAAGPQSQRLALQLGLEVTLEPVLEQVTYFSGVEGVETDWLPGFYDSPTAAEPGLYSMPVPGVGYKIGLDQAIGAYDPANNDRTPSAERTRDIEMRVSRDFAALVPTAKHSLVCSWTDSPDGRFIIDRFWGGKAVLACGDSGTGFKFSALLGYVLADLAEGGRYDPDIEMFAASRLADIATDGAAKRFLQ